MVMVVIVCEWGERSGVVLEDFVYDSFLVIFKLGFIVWNELLVNNIECLFDVIIYD